MSANHGTLSSPSRAYQRRRRLRVEDCCPHPRLSFFVIAKMTKKRQGTKKRYRKSELRERPKALHHPNHNHNLVDRDEPRASSSSSLPRMLLGISAVRHTGVKSRMIVNLLRNGGESWVGQGFGRVLWGLGELGVQLMP